MKLSHLQLEAFEIIARVGSFSKAAQVLHLTQPALSRRIQELEAYLSMTLFLRSAGGVQLTEEGKRLLKYAQSLDLLEEELFFDLSKKTDKELGGMVRINGPASVIHPAVLPSLASFLTKHPHVQITCNALPLSQIAETLFSGQCDFAITDNKIERTDIENHFIGEEHYVLTESTREKPRKNIYLDISPADNTTGQFFKIQKRKPRRYQRSFMNDEWGINIATELGIGRAVKPQHMVFAHSRTKILTRYRPLIKSVYLHYRKQPYYTKLMQSVIATLTKNAPRYLATH